MLKRLILVLVILLLAGLVLMKTSELDRLNDEGKKAYYEANYSEALAKFKKGLEIAEKSAPDKVSLFLNNLSQVYDAMGDYAKAKDLLERALAIDEKHFGKDHPNVAIRVNNLGAVYKALGDYGKAREMYERALAIFEKNLGKEHPNVATMLNNLGMVYDSLGDYGKAREMYERALVIAEQSQQLELLQVVQNWMSDILAKQNHPAPAIFFGKKAVNTIQTMRANIASMEKELQKSFVKSKEHVYKRLADLLIDQGRIPEAQQVLAMLKEEEYFDFIRRDAARSEVRSTTATYTDIEQPWVRHYEKIQHQLAALGKEKADLQQKKKLGLTPEQENRYKELQEDLKAANMKFEAFLTELIAGLSKVSVARAKEIGEKQLEQLRSLQGTLRHLGKGSVLIHYLITDEKLRIILTTPQVQLVRDSIITAKDLNRNIFSFRETIKSYKDPLPEAKALYDSVFKPIADDLKQAAAQTLMISLDGTLRYLPIAALHDGKHYVAEQYKTIIYTEAAKTRLVIPAITDWTVVGLGLTQEIPGYKPLPAVKSELEGIVRIIPGRIHLDNAFTKAVLKDALDTEYPLLHIASHFVFNPGTERDSFLLLGNGDKFSLAQVTEENLDFNSVDLLTLSACNTATGGGKNANGREIEGFGVLAQNKGAKAVLATLWAVSDKSTGIFMQHLYRLRKEAGLDKADALHQAQVMFIQGKVSRENLHTDNRRARQIKNFSGMNDIKPDESMPDSYKHPYYWAPFILMGNWL